MQPWKLPSTSENRNTLANNFVVLESIGESREIAPVDPRPRTIFALKFDPNLTVVKARKLQEGHTNGRKRRKKWSVKGNTPHPPFPKFYVKGTHMAEHIKAVFQDPVSPHTNGQGV